MYKFRKLLSLIVMVSLSLSSLNATAWEQNVHETALYHVLRAAGWAHEPAMLVAKGAQKVDETPESTATGVSHQRALNHFLGDGLSSPPPSTDHSSIPQSMIPRIMSFFGFGQMFLPAVKNAALAYYMIYKGSLSGDLSTVSAGFHHLADAHSRHVGNSPMFGHGHQAHTTDATFFHTKEFQETIYAFARVATRLRFMLPKQMQDTASALNYLNGINSNAPVNEEILKDGNKLAARILADQKLTTLYRTDIQNLKEYKQVALNRFYDYYEANGALNPALSFDELFNPDLVNNSQITFEQIINELILESTSGKAFHIKNKIGVEVPVFASLTNFFKNGTTTGPSEDEISRVMRDKFDYFRSRIESYELLVDNSNKLQAEYEAALAPIKQYLVETISSLTNDQQLGKTILKQFNEVVIELREMRYSEFISKRIALLDSLASKVNLSAAHRAKIDALILDADKSGLAYLANRQNLVDMQSELFSGADIKDYDIKNSSQMEQLAKKLAVSTTAMEQARAITRKFVPVYNNTDSQFAFEDDSSGNRKFELWLNKDLWRKYLASKAVWGVNFISLSEENPKLVEKFKVLLGFKLDVPQLPDTSEFTSLTDNELAKKVGEGNDAAALELAKRTSQRLASTIGDDTKIEAAEVVRLTYGFKQLFTKMMGEYFREILAFRIIPSGKKWDVLYSKAKGSARALFYSDIADWEAGTITDNQKNKVQVLDGKNLPESKRNLIADQLKSFNRSGGGIKCSDLTF